MSIKRDLELMYELGSLRLIDRTWRQLHVPAAANTTEHCFRVIWLALMLAKQVDETVNEELLLKMALVHDVTETRTGDVNWVSRQYNDRKEEQAIHDTLAGTSLTEYEELRASYEQRDTIEAKLVKDADTLDFDLEIMEQAAQVRDSLEGNRRSNVRSHMYTEAAQKFQDAIYGSNPHDWYTQSQVSHTVGDQSGAS
jgi:putative hydrolase of HD superfamily